MAKKNDISTAVFGAIACLVTIVTVSHEVAKEVQNRSKSVKDGDKTIAILLLVAILLCVIIVLIKNYLLYGVMRM